MKNFTFELSKYYEKYRSHIHSSRITANNLLCKSSIIQYVIVCFSPTHKSIYLSATHIVLRSVEGKNISQLFLTLKFREWQNENSWYLSSFSNSWSLRLKILSNWTKDDLNSAKKVHQGAQTTILFQKLRIECDWWELTCIAYLTNTSWSYNTSTNLKLRHDNVNATIFYNC